jgi:hypothetical protein
MPGGIGGLAEIRNYSVWRAFDGQMSKNQRKHKPVIAQTERRLGELRLTMLQTKILVEKSKQLLAQSQTLGTRQPKRPSEDT